VATCRIRLEKRTICRAKCRRSIFERYRCRKLRGEARTLHVLSMDFVCAVRPASRHKPCVTCCPFTTYVASATRFDICGMSLAPRLLRLEQKGPIPGHSESQWRGIMLTMAIQNRVCVRESTERKPWTSEARNDVFAFLAKLFGVVCAAVFLYSLGPAVGMTLIAVILVVWSLLRSQIAFEFEEEEDSPAEDNRHAASVHSPLRCTDPTWLRNGRSGTSMLASADPDQRQGA